MSIIKDRLKVNTTGIKHTPPKLNADGSIETEIDFSRLVVCIEVSGHKLYFGWPENEPGRVKYKTP